MYGSIRLPLGFLISSGNETSCFGSIHCSDCLFQLLLVNLVGSFLTYLGVRAISSGLTSPKLRSLLVSKYRIPSLLASYRCTITICSFGYTFLLCSFQDIDIAVHNRYYFFSINLFRDYSTWFHLSLSDLEVESWYLRSIVFITIISFRLLGFIIAPFACPLFWWSGISIIYVLAVLKYQNARTLFVHFDFAR